VAGRVRFIKKKISSEFKPAAFRLVRNVSTNYATALKTISWEEQ
jgi:hypothetical protein